MLHKVQEHNYCSLQPRWPEGWPELTSVQSCSLRLQTRADSFRDKLSNNRHCNTCQETWASITSGRKNKQEKPAMIFAMARKRRLRQAQCRAVNSPASKHDFTCRVRGARSMWARCTRGATTARGLFSHFERKSRFRLGAGVATLAMLETAIAFARPGSRTAKLSSLWDVMTREMRPCRNCWTSCGLAKCQTAVAIFDFGAHMASHVLGLQWQNGSKML